MVNLKAAESAEQDQTASICRLIVLYLYSLCNINSLPNDKLLDRTRLKALADNKLSVSVMMISLFNLLPDEKILDWSKFKEIADDILKCIESETYVSYRVENIMRKGEIACYKQFLLFSQCFLQHKFLGRQKASLCRNGLGYRKHCGYRRKCWLPAFSPFPSVFSQASFLGFCGKELKIT